MSACIVAAIRRSDIGPSAYGDENAKPGRLATTTWKSGSRSAKSSCSANVCGQPCITRSAGASARSDRRCTKCTAASSIWAMNCGCRLSHASRARQSHRSSCRRARAGTPGSCPTPACGANRRAAGCVRGGREGRRGRRRARGARRAAPWSCAEATPGHRHGRAASGACTDASARGIRIPSRSMEHTLENPVVVEFPLRGEDWMAVTTPAHRVPSHGTDMLGQRYAYDFLRSTGAAACTSTRPRRCAASCSAARPAMLRLGRVHPRAVRRRGPACRRRHGGAAMDPPGPRARAPGEERRDLHARELPSILGNHVILARAGDVYAALVHVAPAPWPS